MKLQVLLALIGCFAASCFLIANADPCGGSSTEPVLSVTSSTKAQRYVDILGGLKKKASPTLLKIDPAFWPDMGVSMDPTAKQLILQARPLLSRKRDSGSGLVEIEIKGTVSNKILRYLQAWGTVIFSSTKYNMIHALVPPSRLATIAKFDGVIYVSLPGNPQTNQASAVNYTGVVSHRANLVQSEGYLGKGVKVGVLSDCVDLIGIAQSDGRLGNVTVLPGAQGWGVSEGVAILEVVHQYAPQAELYFATAYGSDAEYAHNILDLAAAGCQVIVDNIFYFQEPVFEDGIIAQAVTEVVQNNGVIYLSVAGNEGNAFFHTATTYEADYNPTNWTFFNQPFSQFYEDVHLFAPGQSFNTANGITRFITLHWSDPYYNAYADYDLFIFDSTGELVSFSISSGLAFEIAQTYFLPSGTYYIVVARYFGPARFLSLRSYDAQLEYFTDGFIFGHAATTSALAIGAIQQDAPNNYYAQKMAAGYIVPEAFTSDGPRKIFYENGTYVTADLLSTGGLIRQKPDFIAADGLNTVTPGFEMYFGTSCSAASAAGIAALAVSASPRLTPAQFKAAAVASAVDALTPGFDYTTGYGALDAYNLVQTILP